MLVQTRQPTSGRFILRAAGIEKRLIDYWTFGPGRASPEIQKSLPFFLPISSKNIEKQRLKRASTGVRRNDFWTAFLGPPGAHANPKVALGRSMNDSTGHAR